MPFRRVTAANLAATACRARRARGVVAWQLMAVLALVAVLAPASAFAQGNGAPAGSGEADEATWRDRPDPEKMTIDTSKQGSQVPLDLAFNDSTGKSVTLGDYCNGSRPVILWLGYMRCPKLCTIILNNLAKSLGGVDLQVGRDFDIVAISVHPEEARDVVGKKKAYVDLLARNGKPGTDAGWHFLVAQNNDTSNVRAVADSVGWRYRARRNTGTLEYDHGNGIMILTPDGRLSRYLLGIEYDPRTLQLTLLEAAEGNISASVYDNIALYCFHFDPTTGRYTAQAFRIMQIGGLLTVVILGLVVGGWWLKELRASGRADRTGRLPDSASVPPSASAPDSATPQAEPVPAVPAGSSHTD